MKIGYGNIYDPIEESVLPSRAKARTEDGRTAPVSGSDLGVDAQAKNDENKKTAFAASGDRVEISKEARELYQAQASENAEEEERQGHEHSNLADTAESLKGLSEKFMGPGVSGAEGEGEGEGEGQAAKLRKQIKEVQKKLQEAQAELQAAMSKASSDDPAASQAAEAEVQAAQQEMSALNVELQMLQQQLQEAMQAGGGGGGGSGQITPAVGSGWAPSGRRVQVGADGITSLT